MPAATTSAVPTACHTEGRSCSRTSPTAPATAGSTLVRVPKAAVLIRRSAASSSAYGRAGTSRATAPASSTVRHVRSPTVVGAATAVATRAATGKDTASVCSPPSAPLLRCVSTM
ncbi:hypothetical protein GCM10023225_11380 [Kineococcus glutinatus]|uniref:Uncharacterized protein n=1 Tax=Kineococcus glutinatus TaxID=1070872 RepID=A0ABP9HI78_9ACTN